MHYWKLISDKLSREWSVRWALLLSLVMLFLLLLPFFDKLIGRRNTVYSSRFTTQGFDSITVGTPRGKVIDLLGDPIQSFMLPRSYPPWSEGIECLAFSERKDLGDYDVVQVWIGADQKVTYLARAVTD